DAAAADVGASASPGARRRGREVGRPLRDRDRLAGGDDRREPDRLRESLGPGKDVRALRPRAFRADRAEAQGSGPLGPPQPDGRPSLRRNAPEAGDRPRGAAPAAGPLPRRADGGPRPAEPPRDLADARGNDGGRSRARDHPDDARHGRGRPPLRPRGDHGPGEDCLRGRAGELEARPRDGGARPDPDRAADCRSGEGGDPRAGRGQLEVVGAPGRGIPEPPGRGDRTPRGGAPRGTRLSDRAHDDRPRHARGRLLLLHGARAARDMTRAPRARGPKLAVLGIAAICQRAYVTLWRQPVLIISTMLFPVVYLLILGNALNRDLQSVPLAVVNEAGNGLAAECLRGAMALETGRRPIRLVPVAGRDEAVRGLRRGRYRAIWILPLGLSRQGPAPSFIGDNTDRFSFEVVETALRDVWNSAAASTGAVRTAAAVRLEAYPYLDYLAYLAPAVVCLAIFMGSMVAGGLQVIEDRMYGYHEGYLVTPISTGTLVAGHILAGALVASMAGAVVLIVVLFKTPVPIAGPAPVLASFA